MPLVVDGVEIPVEAVTNQASFNQAKSELDALDKQVNGFIADNRRRKTIAEETAKAEIKAAQAAKKAQEDYRASLNRTREDAEKLQQVSSMALMAGAAIVTPMILAAKKFADSASDSDYVARQWRDSMKSLEDSGTKAGRVIADQLNPALKETAKVISTIVGYLEKNPQIAGAALTVGGALIGIGTIGTVVATIEKTVATLALLTGGKAMGGGVAGAVGSAALPVFVMGMGVEAGVVIANAITGANYTAGDFVKAVALSIPTIIETMFGPQKNPLTGESGFTKLSQRIDQILSALPFLAPNELRDPGTKNAVQQNYVAALTSEMILKRQLAADSKEQELVAARQAKAGIQAQIYANEQETQQRQIEAIRKYAAQRAQITAQLEADNQRAYEDYQRNRADTVRDAEIEIKRIREDSQKRLQQMEKDHGQRVYDLLAARDALGLSKENKKYDEEKKLEQDATRQEISRRRADLKLKLEDMARSYNAELKQRRDVANTKLKNLAEEQAAELKLIAAQQKAIYDTLIMAFNAAIVKIKTIGGEYQTPTTGAKASGGYAEKGVYKMGEEGREFVANAATTRALERKMGGSLNQDNILGGAGMTVNINLGAGGNISQNRSMINMMKSEIIREFGRALEAV